MGPHALPRLRCVLVVACFPKLVNAPRGLDTLETFRANLWSSLVESSDELRRTNDAEMMAMAAAAAAAIAAGGLAARHLHGRLLEAAPPSGAPSFGRSSSFQRAQTERRITRSPTCVQRRNGSVLVPTEGTA